MKPRLAVAVLAVAAAGALTACGSGTENGPGTLTELTITVRESPQSAPQTWTLTCDPPGGTHPDPSAACAQLAALPAPFAQTPKDMACTQIYGGPQTATVTGTYRSAPVEATFSQTDGCEIARWDRVAEVLVVRGGA